MKKIRLLILPIITIVLEILPYGAVLVFAPSPTDRVRETFSYFSLTPFGHANFAPFITALISIKQKRVCKALFIVSLVAAVISLLPLAFGFSYFSIVGVIITLMLAAESVLAKITNK